MPTTIIVSDTPVSGMTFADIRAEFRRTGGELVVLSNRRRELSVAINAAEESKRAKLMADRMTPEDQRLLYAELQRRIG